MKHFLPAVCYHPTEIMFIDDNRKFLKNINTWLNQDELSYKTFDNPVVALKFLIEEYDPHPFTDHCLYHTNLDELTPLDCAELGVSIRKIQNEMYRQKRFSEISVIVVDYAMPGLNGVDFCAKLQGLPIKKIMLTGEADERLGIKAFNEGLIDQFIRKEDPDFYTTINNAIHDMQVTYFQDLSCRIVDSLKSLSPSMSFLTDPVFIDFFDDFCNSIQPTEYYLMDQFGSFIFLDKLGSPQWLVVKNETEISSLLEFAKSGDNVPHEVIRLLAERRHIPYFHTDKEITETAPAQWLSFMRLAQKLQGKKDTYYYTIITDPKAHDIGDILSFEKYMQERNR